MTPTLNSAAQLQKGELSVVIAKYRPIKEAEVASYKKLSNKTNKETFGQMGGDETPYYGWRRDDLYHLAQRHGIEDRANMTNEELAHAISKQGIPAP